MSQLTNVHRRSGIALVPVDDQYALIDTEQRRVIILNAAACWIWTRLGTDATIPADYLDEVTEFVAGLNQRRLLGADKDATIHKLEGCLNDCPRILSQTPLQVAANTSVPGADPFLAV